MNKEETNNISKWISDIIQATVGIEESDYGWGGKKYSLINVDKAAKKIYDNIFKEIFPVVDMTPLPKDVPDYPPLPSLMGLRCDEPCCFDPVCRMWFEAKDNYTTEDRAKAMTDIIKDDDCPLFKQQQQQHRV